MSLLNINKLLNRNAGAADVETARPQTGRNANGGTVRDTYGRAPVVTEAPRPTAVLQLRRPETNEDTEQGNRVGASDTAWVLGYVAAGVTIGCIAGGSVLLHLGVKHNNKAYLIPGGLLVGVFGGIALGFTLFAVCSAADDAC